MALSHLDYISRGQVLLSRNARTTNDQSPLDVLMSVMERRHLGGSFGFVIGVIYQAGLFFCPIARLYSTSFTLVPMKSHRSI